VKLLLPHRFNPERLGVCLLARRGEWFLGIPRKTLPSPRWITPTAGLRQREARQALLSYLRAHQAGAAEPELGSYQRNTPRM
jgi:hypothetical protein